MFVFEDLIQVDDRGIMVILKEINNDVLMKALKTASEELKEKIFRNMSERAAQMMKEDLEVMGPVRLKDVEAAQQIDHHDGQETRRRREDRPVEKGEGRDLCLRSSCPTS